VAQVVECLPSKHKAQSSTPTTAKKKKKRKEKKNGIASKFKFFSPQKMITRANR
jgi:hypothetical protein